MTGIYESKTNILHLYNKEGKRVDQIELTFLQIIPPKCSECKEIGDLSIYQECIKNAYDMCDVKDEEFVM